MNDRTDENFDQTRMTKTMKYVALKTEKRERETEGISSRDQKERERGKCGEMIVVHQEARSFLPSFRITRMMMSRDPLLSILSPLTNMYIERNEFIRNE